MNGNGEERPLKILYMMTECFCTGGVQSDLLALSRDLSSRGHEVTVMSKTGPLVGELVARGARHVDLDLWFRSATMYARCVGAVHRFLKEHEFDIMTPQSVRSTLVAAWARAKLPVSRRPPLITTVHNIHSKINYWTAGRVLNRASDFVIFESCYERDRLVHQGLRPAKTTVIHSGIDLDRFCPKPKNPILLQRYGLTESTPVVGTVARVSEEKGFPFLIEAFKAVVCSVPTAVLIVVGDGPLKTAIEKQALDLGLKDHIFFVGPQRDVPQYLSLFDLFVLASTRESFPLAAREAMSAGKPVVATRVGGCHEVVDHGATGYMVPPADPAALAEGITQILNDRELGKQMGRNARIRAEEKFNEKTWTAGNEAIFQQYAGGTKAQEGSAL